MCGITGIYYFNQEKVSREILGKMVSKLKHRGPDGEGIFIKENIGLGHARLKIIDLSDDGTQPMCNEDRTIWITANGEIYNYEEIKKELKKRRHKFRSNTDIEVIIHAYEEWGIDCLKKFNGMFAFAIYDLKHKKLFLVRDRLGIKPLFYYIDNNKVIFGSEIKAILQDKNIKREINPKALHNYLSLNYSTAPLTLFNNIYQVLPGSYLEVTTKGMMEKKYWDVSFVEAKGQKKDSNWLEEFDHLLYHAVKKRLMSDVPFGAFLSGGIDSSSIVYYMRKILGNNVKTFSMGFKEGSFNELDDSALVSDKLQTDHYSEVVQSDIDENFLNKIVWHSEEPTADSSIIPMFHLSQMTKNNVTMALSGDGADELLAGYETYQAYYLRKTYRYIPKFIRTGICAGIINKLPVSLTKVSLDYKLKTFVKGSELPLDESHFYWRTIFNEEFKRTIYSENFKNLTRDYNSFDFAKPYFDNAKGDPVNRMLEFDTKFYLPNDMLIKVDRASMANSLEVRVPFLDHELVEFVAKMPVNLKLRFYYKKKYALKKIMQDRLPNQILKKRKLGFNVPVNVWMKGPFHDMVREILSQQIIKDTGIFDYKQISSMLDQHQRGLKDYGYQLWSLLIFITWWKMFLKDYI